ncbi:hypothetical protein F511_12046 [Dorcoceras hygrometricum]|uniref:Uncharacterized protein n=1 Tax=Dorcoceras hygrometricum TaxID=472368 RepID=A0A2Z7D8H7_9LAMI|nr:hypothetical protein F511_12046 [Dorcoceras hygrometricum]
MVGSQNLKADQEQIQLNNSGHGVCEYMGATHSSQHTAPDAKHSSTCCCTTHEAAVDSSIRSTTGRETPSSACTRRPDEINTDGNSSSRWPEQVRRGKAAAAARGKHGGGVRLGEEGGGREESRIQYLCDPQWFRDTASRGPTTIAAPKSQFRTCPMDHGKASSNIAP